MSSRHSVNIFSVRNLFSSHRALLYSLRKLCPTFLPSVSSFLYNSASTKIFKFTVFAYQSKLKFIMLKREIDAHLKKKIVVMHIQFSVHIIAIYSNNAGRFLVIYNSIIYRKYLNYGKFVTDKNFIRLFLC